MSITFSPMTALTQLRFEAGWPARSTARVAVGEVDLATVHLLRDRLLDIQRERTPAALDVDVAGVTFLDCTGISAQSPLATPPSGPGASCGSATRNPMCAGCWR